MYALSYLIHINNKGFIRAFYFSLIGEKCHLQSNNLFPSKDGGGGGGGRRFCLQKLGGKVQTARQNDAIGSLESKEELMGSS